MRIELFYNSRKEQVRLFYGYPRISHGFFEKAPGLYGVFRDPDPAPRDKAPQNRLSEGQVSFEKSKVSFEREPASFAERDARSLYVAFLSGHEAESDKIESLAALVLAYVEDYRGMPDSAIFVLNDDITWR
jgi:hypothetical protein